jgi:hypothetical protein
MTDRPKSRRLSPTQRMVLINAREGRRLDYQRPATQSAAAGWGCSIDSCVRHGLLDRAHNLTESGRAAIGEKPAP